MLDTDKARWRRDSTTGQTPPEQRPVHDGCHAVTPKPRRQFNFPLLPALAVAALPKCPLCLMSVMSVVGLGSLVRVTWLLPLTVALLGLAVAIQLLNAYRRRAYKLAWLSLAGAAAVLLGKFQVDFVPLVYTGLVMLIVASLWNYRLKRRADDVACHC